MTTTVASMLPTPPSSPSPSPNKLIIVPTISTGALPTTSPSQPAKDLEELCQLGSAPVANVESTVHTKLTPLITTTTTTITNAPATGGPPSRTLAALKNDLRFSDWKCGAQTLENKQCQRAVIQKNKALINAQLASMTGLTRASPDLESALVKLVMLVHCHQHDAGRPKERRLEAWTLTFPSGSADGSIPGVSVDQLIRDALRPLDIKCFVCGYRLGGWKVQNCERTIQELIKHETYSDDAKLEFLLKVLEWNRTCKLHQSSRQFKRVTTWMKSVRMILSHSMPLGDQVLASKAPNEPQTSAKTEADLRIATNLLTNTEKRPGSVVQVMPSPRASPGPTVSLDADPALYWPKANDSSPFDILAPANHDMNPIRLRELIRTEISKELKLTELKDGYVYAYEVEGNEGYVKIGYTTRPGTLRHDEWSFNCNRQIKLLYPSPTQAATTESSAKEVVAAPTVPVPHAHRVEALCHAELNHRHIRIYCTACRQQHIEWFKVSATEATAVIQKWSRWMATHPYELRQFRVNSKWSLKINEKQRTLKFDQFMRDIAEAPAPL
jgi:hypothetical protein